MASLKFRHTSTSDLAFELRKQSAGKRFEFVTLSNPGDIKSHSVQRKIRRHAGQTSSKPTSKRRRNTSYSLELAPSPDSASGSDVSTPQSVQSDKSENGKELDYYVERHAVISGEQRFLQSLGFPTDKPSVKNYALEHDSQTQILVEFLIYDAKINYTEMCRVCVKIALEDKSSWQIMLAGAAMLLYDRGGKEEIGQEALIRYSKCLKDIQTRLDDPKERVSDGIISAILTFAFQDARRGHMDSFKMHILGIQKLVENRGGMEAFANSTTSWMNMTIIWADTAGAIMMDQTPVFEKPPKFLEISSVELAFPLLMPISKSLAALSNHLYDVSGALDLIAKMSININSKEDTNQLEYELYTTKTIIPVAHHILGLPRYLENIDHFSDVDQIQILREIIRLSCLMYLVLAKDTICPGTESGSTHTHKLIKLMDSYQPHWTPYLHPLKLWIYAILATSQDTVKNHDISTERFVSSMKELGISSWPEVSSVLKDVAWMKIFPTNELQNICKNQMT